MLALALVLLFVVGASAQDDGFVLSLLKDEAAVCLDGSPGGYYFRPGSGTGGRGRMVHEPR